MYRHWYIWYRPYLRQNTTLVPPFQYFLMLPLKQYKPIFNIRYQQRLHATKRRKGKFIAKIVVPTYITPLFIKKWLYRSLKWIPSTKLWKKILFLYISLQIMQQGTPIMYWYKSTAVKALKPRQPTTNRP